MQDVVLVCWRRSGGVKAGMERVLLGLRYSAEEIFGGVKAQRLPPRVPEQTSTAPPTSAV